MKKDRIYLFFLALLFGGFLLVKLTERQPLNWNLTLDYTSKDPYGTAALHALLPALFSDVLVEKKTIYELRSNLKPSDNIFVLAKNFEPGHEDISAILDLANTGSQVFLSAESFGKALQDTLHFEVYHNFFDFTSFRQSDSLFIAFNTTLNGGSMAFGDSTESSTNKFYFKSINQRNHVTRYAPDSARVLAINERRDINTIRIPYGKGQIFINSTPAFFTNIYALGPNRQFIASLLSVMPSTKLIWFENYQVGNRELQTPLRYILTTEPLAWAYYLSMGAILLFMAFEVRRKQRAIPIIKPLSNQSLEFASTISTLYFQRGDHKNIADKRIHYFYDYVRQHFYLTGHEPDFVEKLSIKSVKPLQQMEALVNTIVACQQARTITVNQLTDLNKKIEDFYPTQKIKTSTS